MEQNEKEKLINSFNPKSTYIGTEIRLRISSAKIKSSDEVEFKAKPPTKFKKGDVITCHEGKKSRPCVVIKQIKDSIIYIPLTSTENINTSPIKHNSRFFREGYFCIGFSVCNVEYASQNFVGVLDDNKNLNLAIQYNKQFFNKL